jgi:hypothetical protein
MRVSESVGWEEGFEGFEGLKELELRLTGPFQVARWSLFEGRPSQALVTEVNVACAWWMLPWQGGPHADQRRYVNTISYTPTRGREGEGNTNYIQRI